MTSTNLVPSKVLTRAYSRPVCGSVQPQTSLPLRVGLAVAAGVAVGSAVAALARRQQLHG